MCYRHIPIIKQKHNTMSLPATQEATETTLMSALCYEKIRERVNRNYANSATSASSHLT